MNKTKVIALGITVLAVIGTVAVYKYVTKPKTNSDGFYNMYGY
jgi:multisubunit Na+/H+ antiporter MnhF subunit